MICLGSAKKYCKDDISLIENYDKAVNDNERTWECHHRRENISSRKELIENNEYYNRPASELIFLTPFEHISLHSKGNKYMLGKYHSDETKRKMSEAHKFGHWFNNGIIAVRAKECPEGFVKGRLKKTNIES